MRRDLSGGVFLFEPPRAPTQVFCSVSMHAALNSSHAGPLSDCRLAWDGRTGRTKQAEDGEDSPPVRPSTAPPRPRRRPLPSLTPASAVWLLGDSGHREWHKVGRKDDALPNDHQQDRPSTSWISQRHRDEARRGAGRGGRGGRGTVRRGGGKAAPQQVRLRGRCTSLGPKLRPMSSPVQRTL